MGRPTVKSRRAVTILPIVLAILFMLLLSMLSIAVIARAMFSGC